MVWSGRSATGSGVKEETTTVKEETTADFRCTAIRISFTADNFSAHSKCALTHTDNSAAQAAKKAHSH